ncbi:MAG: Rne/Rng family ribonuclease [Polyangiaceae bacterium]|nr:Rne/Rng family ribonuclease [Polyangiaceae bacterium]
MAKNILVVSCDVAETRVALIESGIIAELHIERRGAHPREGTVGDVYVGRVTRVLPGLQAAFVDIGLERAAFLHVEDLIRPDDFEAYLAGGRKQAASEGGRSKGEGEPPEDTSGEPDDDDLPEVAAEAEAAPRDSAPESVSDYIDESDAADAAEVEVPEVDDLEESPIADDHPDGGASEALEGEGDDGGELDEALPVATPPAAPVWHDAHTNVLESVVAGVPRIEVNEVEETVGEAETRRFDDPDSQPPPVGAIVDDGFDDLLDNPNLPGFTISDPGAPMPRAPAPRLESASRDGRAGGGAGADRRRRRRGRDRGRGGREAPRREHPRPERSRTSAAAGRLSKSTPIRDVVKEGQEIIVQITKEPIGTKGARCSSHISLPGRYVVYLPTLEHVGVSKRIGSDKERARLREAIDAMKPPAGGLIVRTVAEGLTKKQLKQDVGYLVHLWGDVAKKRESARAPALLLGELDIVLKAARDLFTDEVDQLVIDDRSQYDRLYRFVEMFMPERLKDIVYYGDPEPIFDAYGIEDEISRALSRKVPLPSGGYLIIDEAEALTAIDVNTGRFVGKGSKDMEETILKTNLEAVQEIAYQLRFRNIGGLIILDLIDMEKASNREKVRRTLEEILQRDKAKTTLNRISELGLIEMTRKRTRESIGRLLHEPCFYCDGTGHLQSKETIAYEILREIRRKRQDLPGYTILVNCHPAVADLLTGSEKNAVQDAESRYMRRIQVASRTEYHLEQFDLSGK